MEETETRRTKIVATIGPSSAKPETLEALIRAGVDVARLNFSHGTHADHERVARMIREAESAMGKPIAILQDLQGPKIRLGKLAQPITLTPGQEVVLSSLNDFVGTDARRLPTTYESLAYDVCKDELILLADGRLALSVRAVDGSEVTCRVEVGGEISSSKGINLPGTRTSIPSLTDRDILDLEFGLRIGVDYVALSFVRSPLDLALIRQQMLRLGRQVPVIAKIEKPQAVDYLEAIIDASDGIMVARGDLGVELPPEQVPTIQRRAIRMARERGKLTIVATQMLMSMTKHPRPTHAEVSDVANAVCDGTDAVMLSDETASGAYPIESVTVMSALVASAESSDEPYEQPEFTESLRKSHAWAISRAAVVTAHELGASAIVSYTHRGLGPRLMANWRPKCTVLGCATADEDVRRMAFYWGVRPTKIARPSSLEALVSAVESVTLDRGILKRGETIVITSKMPLAENQPTNVLKLHSIAPR